MLAVQGQKLQWHLTSSNEYAIESLPGEVLAAGDAAVHKQALELLAWDEASVQASWDEYGLPQI